EISEKIGGPIFLRSTTDISHVASDVEIGKKLKLEKREAHNPDILVVRLNRA
ncbi:unnamed protein product, partial [marine sediment metagenome]